MRPDGEDEARLAEADEAPAADSIVYSLSRAVNWGSWRPQPPAAPIAALAVIWNPIHLDKNGQIGMY